MRVAQGLLEDNKLDAQNKANILHYLVEALTYLGKNTLVLRQYLERIHIETTEAVGESRVMYVREEGECIEKSDYKTMLWQQIVRCGLLDGRLEEALNACVMMRQKSQYSRCQYMKDAVLAMQLKCNLDRKFLWPYLKV